MSLDRRTALDFMTGRHQGVLVTIRSSGLPQSSNIAYLLADGVARISVTADRAKTANLRRDPRSVLHVSSDDFWQYVSASCSVELSDTASRPDDDVVAELHQVYEGVSGAPHPDRDEFGRAMVADGRLVVRLTIDDVVGQVSAQG